MPVISAPLFDYITPQYLQTAIEACYVPMISPPLFDYITPQYLQTAIGAC